MLYACNIYCLSHKLKFLYSGTARASPDSGLFGSLGGATASRGQLRFRRRRNPWHHRPELRERFLIFFTLCPFLDSLYTRTIRLLIISVSTRSCVNKNFNNILLKLVLQTKNYVAIQKKKSMFCAYSTSRRATGPKMFLGEKLVWPRRMTWH